MSLFLHFLPIPLPRLCMWVDINQKYVDLGLFPQWDDIARELNIDQMKTEWVKVTMALFGVHF